jgi:hypothetical protein
VPLFSGSSSPKGVAVCVILCYCHSVLTLSLGGDFQVWGLAGCILNKLVDTVDRGWSSSLVVGWEANNLSW